MQTQDKTKLHLKINHITNKVTSFTCLAGVQHNQGRGIYAVLFDRHIFTFRVDVACGRDVLDKVRKKILFTIQHNFHSIKNLELLEA